MYVSMSFLLICAESYDYDIVYVSSVVCYFLGVQDMF